MFMKDNGAYHCENNEFACEIFDGEFEELK